MPSDVTRISDKTISVNDMRWRSAMTYSSMRLLNALQTHHPRIVTRLQAGAAAQRERP